MRLSKPGRAVVITTVALALTASTLAGVVKLTHHAARGPVAAQQQASVAGRAAAPVAVAAPARHDWQPTRTRWPAAGTLAEGPVKLQVFDQTVADRTGVHGVVVRVAGRTGTAPQQVSLDYSGYRDAYGGDWASRLGLEQLPDCALSTPDVPDCRTGQPVPSRNDAQAQRVTADVPAAGGVFALAATPGGGTGDYRATALSPSANWQVSEQSGDFDWSYDLRTPSAPDSSTPTLTMSYSAQSVDGRTASTNNQTSWIGEGWDMWSGYIERQYMSCADNGGNQYNGDECWNGDNATISLGGMSTELIRDDTTGTWRLKDDNGSRVEKLTGATNGDNDGEYWRVTTSDGTQYYFGLNRLPGWATGDATTNSTWTVPVYGNNAGEPCHGSSFADSSCDQAWRWNLDYVVDPHGNAASYLYTQETNYYRRGYQGTSAGTMASYVRGGYLHEIDYGQRPTSMYSASPLDKVVFGVSERCLPDSSFDCATSKFTKANASHWPDVPFDENCGSSDACTSNVSPSFWSRKRLTSVATEVRVGSSWQNVDTWTLDESFPAPGDGTTPSLWLDKITHTGDVGGSLSVPPVVFGMTQLQNRVDTVGDSLAPLDKYRIGTIDTETGAHLSITYSDKECTAAAKPDPATNTQRCFPQYWAGDPPQPKPFQDWFHKYVVTQVSTSDLTGGAADLVTTYNYLDSPAWAYDNDVLTKAKERTWGDWRGYSKVGEVTGAPGQPQSEVDYVYFRGMNGDRADADDASKKKTVSVTDSTATSVPDDPQLAGRQREKVDLNGPGGTVVDDVIDDPWTAQTATHTDSAGTRTANLTDTGVERTRTALSGGGWRTTEVDHGYDGNGLPTTVNDLGDTTIGTDDKCTRTTYAQNTAAWMLSYPSREEVVATACTATPDRPADVLSDQRTSYDSQSWGTLPTKGDDTRVESVTGYTGGNPVYLTTKLNTFDAYGRLTATTDAMGRTTKTAYTPASGGLVTHTTVTDPKGYTTDTDLNPATDQATTILDENSKRTDLTYDPLGRLTQVWLPGRLKSANPTTPNLAYGYQIRGATGTTAVSTATLHASGQYATSYQLYDGLLRERQTQVPAPGGGRVITDQIYDSRGLVARANSDYYNGDTAPSADLFTPKAAVPGQTATTYDGVGRPILATFLENGNARWQTVTSYGGDRVSVTPPKGAIATTQIADARGQLTQLLQYHGGQPTGAADVISYTYAPDGQVSTITDEAGNTWSYRYDLRGRRIEEHDPDTGTTTNTYDDDDELLTSTDGRGVTLAYSYDALGRKTGEYQDSLTGTPLARWDYDTLAKGELTDSVRYLGGQPYTTTVLGYDDRYQSLGTTLTVPATETGLAGSYTSHATYNTGADGTPLTVTYPGAGTTAGETVTFGYDTIGEATTLTGLASYVAGTTYSKIGLVSQRSSSDGAGHLVYRTNTYEDGTNRLLRVYDERSTVSGALNDTHYGYDDGGNVTSIDDAPTAAPADTQCFTYDYLQRLVTARTTGSTCDSTPAAGALGSGPAPYWQSFGYDVAGNRTSETDHAVTPGGTDATHTYTYPSPGGVQPHTVQSVTTTGGPDSDRVDSYGYDPAGDTTNRALAGDAQTLTWDAEGRLASATKDGKTSTFAYDADGTLLLRRDPGSTVLYVDGEEITVNSAGALATTRYYSFGGDTIAVRTGTGLSFLLDDRQGTASTMVSADATQAVTRRYYTPFGQARGVTPAWPGDKGYVGGIVDTAANLTIVGAREYDPDTGRFLSADPVFDIHTPQSWNAYGYANSNPTTYSDPSGLMLPCASGAGGCGKTGYVGGGKKPGYCDLHDCNPGPRVPPSVFHSGKAWNAYQRTLSARWAKVEAQIAAQKREAERRAAEVQRGRNHHHSWWDRVTSFANTVAPALTLIAVATAWVPGLDVVTAAIALTADTLSFAANGADTVVQLAHGHFARAATAAGLAGLSVVGAGGAGKLIRETRELSEARATYRTAKLAWQHAPTGITRARALISAVKVDSARQAVRQSVATDTVNWTSEFVYEVGHKVHESMEEGE